MKARMILSGALVALAALGLFLTPSQVLAAKKNIKIKGTITAVNALAGTVTIEDSEGNAVTLTVDEATTIHKNNDEGASIEDLAVGDTAKAKYNTETLVAKRIQAKSPVAKVNGTITAVDLDAGSVTIQPDEGDPVTLLVTEDTALNRNDEPATLSDFVVGDNANAKYDPLTMIAKRINASSESDDDE